jgi:23S rRNA U2552 (ribose-2'-O)-methylase RlmE/FtsJ
MNKNTTLIYQLPKSSNDILKYEPELELSSNIEYPKFSLGFQHFVHQNKDKLNIFADFKNKKKVYLVMNEFEHKIDDYDDSLELVTPKYLKLDEKKEIIGRSFYKFWEILMSFNLFSNNTPITTAHIADRGTSIQAISCYRELYSKHHKSDKYHNINIKSGNLQSFLVPVDKSISVSLNRTTKKQSRGVNNELFNDNIKDVDLIMAYTGYNWNNKNIQEQQAHRLLLGEIIIALKIQKKGGNFVCKIYESYTITTIKLIEILLSVYDGIFVIKPFMSRAYNSEKFLVCKGFQGVDPKIINKLESLLDKLSENQNKNIANIFPKYKISNELLVTFIKLNTHISNKQLININEIIDFLNKQNYRGDTYNERRELQIKNSQYWISRFFGNDADKQKKSIIEDNEKIVKDNLDSINLLSKTLV